MNKAPRHSYFSRFAPVSFDGSIPGFAFEQALIDVANATDGGGAAVRLIPIMGIPTAKQLAQLTREFADNMLQEGCVFIVRDAITGNLIESTTAERVAWANLALLARATAAAIHFENTKETE